MNQGVDTALEGKHCTYIQLQKNLGHFDMSNLYDMRCILALISPSFCFSLQASCGESSVPSRKP